MLRGEKPKIDLFIFRNFAFDVSFSDKFRELLIDLLNEANIHVKEAHDSETERAILNVNN